MKYSQSKRALTLFKKWSCQTALMIKHIFMVMRNSIPLKLNLIIILKNLIKSYFNFLKDKANVNTFYTKYTQSNTLKKTNIIVHIYR
jgi:hypothetical protein